MTRKEILFRCGADLRERINAAADKECITQREWLVKACEESLERGKEPTEQPLVSKVVDGRYYV